MKLTLLAASLLLVSQTVAAHPHPQGWSIPDLMRPPRLGIAMQSMTGEERQKKGAPADAGVLVGDVKPGSPAAKAGVKADDVLIEIDDAKVTSRDEIQDALEGKDGLEVTLIIVRDKAKVPLKAKLTRSKGAWKMAFPDENFEERLTRIEAEIRKLTEKLDSLKAH